MKKFALATLLAATVAMPALAQTVSSTTTTGNSAGMMAPATNTTTTTTTSAPTAVKLSDGTTVYTTIKSGKTYVWKSDKQTAVGAGSWTTADGKTITTAADGTVIVK